MEPLSYLEKRMVQRGVTFADIESAMAMQVETPRPGNKRGRTVIRGFTGSGKLLDVVLDEAGEPMNVFWSNS
ncbi:MAG TPA: hypothetical protein VMM60_09900 [Ilumatobacter sp.]|nr:hypothetical protein [Ilumatobacter sp.]